VQDFCDFLERCVTDSAVPEYHSQRRRHLIQCDGECFLDGFLIQDCVSVGMWIGVRFSVQID
jgi:hypothetical protein